MTWHLGISDAARESILRSVYRNSWRLYLKSESKHCVREFPFGGNSHLSSSVTTFLSRLGLHKDLHQVTYHLIVLHPRCNWAMRTAGLNDGEWWCQWLGSWRLVVKVVVQPIVGPPWKPQIVAMLFFLLACRNSWNINGSLVLCSSLAVHYFKKHV